MTPNTPKEITIQDLIAILSSANEEQLQHIADILAPYWPDRFLSIPS